MKNLTKKEKNERLLTNNQEETLNKIYGRNFLQGKSRKEVLALFDFEDKAIYDEIMEAKSITDEAETIIMERVLSAVSKPNWLNTNHPDLKFVKKLAFESAKKTIMYHAINLLEKYETRLTFKELFFIGLQACEKKWMVFMQRPEQEKLYCIEHGKAVFAPFQKFIASYVRAVMRKEIESVENAEEISSAMPDLNYSAKRKINLIQKAIKSFICKNGIVPTDEQISELTGINLKFIVTANRILNRVEVEEDYDKENLYLTEIQLANLADDENTENNVYYSLAQKQLKEDLEKNLTLREADVIICYFGLFGYRPLTLEEIANKYSCTRENIRQLKEKALNKLKSFPEVIENLMLMIKK